MLMMHFVKAMKNVTHICRFAFFILGGIDVGLQIFHLFDTILIFMLFWIRDIDSNVSLKNYSIIAPILSKSLTRQYSNKVLAGSDNDFIVKLVSEAYPLRD